MNASSTDSRRVCAFRLSCFVFCEITASLPSCRPSGRSFCILVPDTPGPEFVGNSRERARRSPARGFHRFGPPLVAAPKPAAPLGVSHGEAGKPTAPPGLLHGEARKPTAPPGLFHGEARKPTAPLGLLHGEARKPTAPPGVRHGEVRKPTAPPGLLHGEARKPTAPPGVRHGEARKLTASPGLLYGEAGKPTTAVAFARTGLFRPRGRPERRASL